MNSSDQPPDRLSDYLRAVEQERRQAEQQLAELCPQLASLGVQQVEIQYDGYGDSGAIEELHALAGEHRLELPEDLSQALTSAAECLLPWGWENNEGAFGKFILEVAQRQIRREHNWRVESTEYEEETIEL